MGGRQGGLMVSPLNSGSERVVQVRALAGDIVLCSLARHVTLTVPLSTKVYKWMPVNCWGNLTNCGGVTCDGLASHPGEVELILLAASCYRNQDKLQQLWAILAQWTSNISLRSFIANEVQLRSLTKALTIVLVMVWTWQRVKMENRFNLCTLYMTVHV